MVDTSNIRDQLSQLRLRQQGSLEQQQGAIGQFFDNPQRQQDIQNQVQPGIQRAIADLQRGAQDGSRGIALGNARNLGGSVQQQQLGRLSESVQRQGLQIGGQQSAQTNQLQNLLLQQQAQQQQQALQLNPFQNQGLQSLNQGLGGSIQGVNQSLADMQRAQGQQQFASDEISRGIGNALGLVSQNVRLNAEAQGRGFRGFS